jgi:hypothetical protein
MDPTTDIGAALSSVMERLNTRYIDPTRSTSNLALEAGITEDQNRVDMLKTLQRLAADPARSAAIQQGVDAQMAMARQNASDQAGSALGQVVGAAAQGGMLGSSHVGKARGQIASARDQAVREAAGMATDWQKGVQSADRDYLYGALQSILAPTQESGGAMGAMQQGYQTNLGLGQQLQEVRQQQGQILSQTLGGMMSSFAPVISGSIGVARDRRRDGADYRTGWQLLSGSN